MDGYAVRYADFAECSPNRPAILQVIGEIAAGSKPKIIVDRGQAMRIFTGAMMPEGADTIVIQENTELKDGKVYIFVKPEKQQFVRHKGSFYQAGNPLLNPGIKLGPAEIAVIASAQCQEIKVYRRPQVAIISTGDELVNPNVLLQPGQIVDSNQYALASFIADRGWLPLKLGIVPDNRELIKEKIAFALNNADVVLSTGGVSVGDYDYVDEILRELGGEIKITSVGIKPGKPLTVATFSVENRIKLYFGIPGNPVSALVTCWRFIESAIKKLSGLKGEIGPEFIKAKSRESLRADGKRETYLWGKLILNDGMYEFGLAKGSHSSGNLINLSQTNALAVIPIGKTSVAPGELVTVMRTH
jgi:molybdopterin molybdotransferase